MAKKLNKTIIPSLPFLLFLITFAVIYSPALYFNYLYHDDVQFWHYPSHPVHWFEYKHYQFNLLIAMGRYIDAWILNIEGAFIYHVPDLKFPRILSLFLLSASSNLLFIHLCRTCFKKLHAFLITILIFTLPGFVFVSTTPYFAYYISILLPCLAARHVINGGKIFLPIFLMVVSLAILQHAAMFYWTLAGIFILFSADKSTKEFKTKFTSLMFTGLTSVLIYFIITRIINHFNPPPVHIKQIYTVDLMETDWPRKLHWFFNKPMPIAANFWSVFPKRNKAMIVYLFIISAVLAGFLRKLFVIRDLRKRVRYCLITWGKGCLILIITFLTFMPNLAADTYAPWYRCVAPLSSLILMMFVWAVWQWLQLISSPSRDYIFTILLSLIVVYAGATAFSNTLCYRVLPSVVEWNVLQSAADHLPFMPGDQITILAPLHHKSIERDDEFGVVTSHFPLEIIPLLRCVFSNSVHKNTRSLQNMLSSDSLRITHNSPGQTIYIVSLNNPAQPGPGRVFYLNLRHLLHESHYR